MIKQTKRVPKAVSGDYDKVSFVFPKGTKQVINAFLEKKREENIITVDAKYTSLTSYILSALNDAYLADTDRSLIDDIVTFRKG